MTDVETPDWGQVYAQHFSGRIPEHTFLTLGEVQKQQVLDVWLKSEEGKGFVFLDFDTELAGLENRGLAYLLLDGPSKYTLWEHGDQNLVLELLQWDAQRLDTSHRNNMRGDEQELLVDQAARSVCATLHNKNLSPEAVGQILDYLQKQWDTVYPEPEGWTLCQILDYTLWDKWSPAEFPETTRAAVEAFFRENGAEDEADRFAKEAIAAKLTEY